MFAVRAALILLLAVPASSRSFEEHKRLDGMQVWQSSSKGRDVMWGRCNGWFRQLKSCVLQEAKCASRLSDGPSDADVEVRIGNLPVFKNHPTFLQWWAPRRSEKPYDPFNAPEDAEVYPSQFQAYPHYDDADFNGGNVQVSPSGEAVIRFRAPATYRMHKHTRLPHVHLRICSEGPPVSIILGRKDKIQLTSEGPIAKSECNTDESKLNVLSFRYVNEYFFKQNQPVAAMSPKSMLSEHLDLDALEFSPVYQCLSSGLYYDHIVGDCVQACSEGAVLSHAQCVIPAQASNSFSTTFQLQVCGCDRACWADKRNMTLHRLRLEIADHMDIPMHEVHELDLSFMSGDPRYASVANMHIRINSPRHTTDMGIAMLRSLFQDMQRSSEVLTMLVLEIRELTGASLGFLQREPVNHPSEDVFAPFYQDLDIVKASTPEEDNVSMPAPVEDATSVVLSTARDVFCLSLATAGVAFLVLRCFRGAKARELPHRGLQEPLAMEAGESDPPLFPGARLAHARDAVRVCDPIYSEKAVSKYLMMVYARALQ
mmetsp:Transcript_22408/g.40389  ORF Transcript_22408/g.40389 Transcript_22408/m.40389 type:complete len:542 (-) Transcript_22408:210-1835(-)